MSNALITGVTGLRVHQEMLDVVGNNLANVNTTGFKSQNAQFADLLYDTLAPATSSSSGQSGGTNPLQIGMGVILASIQSNFQQGSLQSTGNPLDLAIQGNGFFVVNNGSLDLYTRAGSFGLDPNNFLVDPSTGHQVQRTGSVGEGDAVNPAFQKVGDSAINIPFGRIIPGKITASVTFQGNLSANASGPVATILTSAQPLKNGAAAATTATSLTASGLTGLAPPYVAGDVITINGTDANANPVSSSFTVTATSTLGNLISQINSAFTQATASMDASGNLVLTANNSGPAFLSLTLADQAGNTGGFPWTNHNLVSTVNGKGGDTQSSLVQVFDSQGNSHNMSMLFTKQANNSWDLTATLPPTEGTMINGSITGILFNEDGSFRGVANTTSPQLSFLINGLSTPQTVTLALGTPGLFNGLSQVGGPSSAAVTNQDGFAAGYLNSVAIGKDGTIKGVFTNGRTLPLAQMAIATFSNPAGLNREGNNYYTVSNNSGLAITGAAGGTGRGTVQQGTLEASNVDVALEFTRLITAQRGFQVNTRVITVGDQVLQDLANIIR